MCQVLPKVSALAISGVSAKEQTMLGIGLRDASDPKLIISGESLNSKSALGQNSFRRKMSLRQASEEDRAAFYSQKREARARYRRRNRALLAEKARERRANQRHSRYVVCIHFLCSLFGLMYSQIVNLRLNNLELLSTGIAELNGRYIDRYQ